MDDRSIAQTDEANRRRAEDRVGAMIGFYLHTTVVILVSFVLLLVDVLTVGGWWLHVPVAALAGSVLVHGLVVFPPPLLRRVASSLGRSVSGWRERKVDEIVRHDSQRHG